MKIKVTALMMLFLATAVIAQEEEVRVRHTSGNHHKLTRTGRTADAEQPTEVETKPTETDDSKPATDAESQATTDGAVATPSTVVGQDGIATTGIVGQDGIFTTGSAPTQTETLSNPTSTTALPTANAKSDSKKLVVGGAAAALMLILI
ncbi:hypothetical protein HDU92_003134 [Lobulomyces angularis]|nr:hypothetical protein HDU92_003134 [Lobulomyces angularis]